MGEFKNLFKQEIADKISIKLKEGCGMKKTIYIFSSGTIRRKGNTIYFESDKGKKYIPVENVAKIQIFGEVTINKKVLEFFSQKEIILSFFNHYGYYMGSFYPREHYNSGFVVLKQAEFYNNNEKRLKLAKLFVKGSMENMLKVTQYYERRGVRFDEEAKSGMIRLKNGVERVNSIEELMAFEGNFRDYYYRCFPKIVKDEDFSMNERTRRPPLNRMNALISFGNALLYTEVLSEIYKTHLDPRIGYLHTTNSRRFSLNLDVSEIFKPPIVDRLIFSLVNKEIIKKSDFQDKLGGIFLKEKGMKKFCEKFEEKLKTTIKHQTLKRNVSYRTLIRLELYKIEKHIIEDKEYEPYSVRW